MELMYEPVMIDYTRKGVVSDTFNGKWVNLMIPSQQATSVSVTEGIMSQKEYSTMTSHTVGVSLEVGYNQEAGIVGRGR